MQDPDPTAADEAFLDDVFDAVTMLMANGEPVDAARWQNERPHLAEQVADTVQLASEVCRTGENATPRAIPGYEIVRELGRGGMGSVFLAQQASLGGRLVALKVLPQAAALSRQARARFQNEIQALARLRHRNIIEIYDVVDSDVAPAYAMEWVDGESLQERIDRRSTGGQQLIAKQAQEIAGALVAAHGEGLLHRDVKPSNIMVRRDGTAVLTDFGLVRDEDSSLMTHSGAFLGTPAYAAPEQLRGERCDERTDVYGLGATLYHALAGEPPYGRMQPGAVLRAVEAGSMRPLHKFGGVDRDLVTIVEAAMVVEPSGRYASAAALGEDLRRYLDGEPVHARRASTWARVGKYVRRNRSSLRGALVGSLLAVAGAVLVAMYLVRQAGLPARFAEHVRTAHLALLDPTFDERMAVLIHRPTSQVVQQYGELMRSSTTRRLATAVHSLDAALELIEDAAIRAERDTVLDALQRLGRGATDLEERDLTAMNARERRSFGLLALLLRHDAQCIAAWRGLDLAADQDPLVDTALGQLYRQRGQPELAWPRLERAFEHFHEADFLCASVAEVALACGDPSYALRVLDRMRGQYPDETVPYDAATRVRAEALHELGRTAEARTLFHRHSERGNLPPSSHESLARFFEFDGDYARALHHRWRMQLRWPMRDPDAKALGALLEAWWRDLNVDARRALVADRSFADALRRARDVVTDPSLRAAAERLPAPAVLPRSESLLPGLSHAVLSGAANAPCQSVSLSADGRFVAFSSDADNLVAGDDNGERDVFVHDRRTGTTACVTLGGSGPSELPTLSADGRWLAFYSEAANLTDGDDNARFDCFVHDLHAGTTTRVGDVAPAVAAGTDWRPRTPLGLSADGNRVLFLIGAAQEQAQLVVVDRRERTVVWRSPVPSKRWVSGRPVLSADGWRVAVTSSEATLVEPDANGWMGDVFAVDLRDGTFVRWSELDGRQANCECRLLDATPDLRKALLWTLASNLDLVDAAGSWHLMMRDDTNGRIRRIATVGREQFEQAATNGSRTVFSMAGRIWLATAEGMWPISTKRDCAAPRISADGRFAAYQQGGQIVGVELPE